MHGHNIGNNNLIFYLFTLFIIRKLMMVNIHYNYLKFNYYKKLKYINDSYVLY